MDSRRSSALPVVVLLVLGVLLRLLLALVILPDAGAPGDFGAYTDWALALADVGPSAFYDRTNADYFPGYLYVLWPFGEMCRGIALATNMDPLTITKSLIKLPAILLDVCAGFMLHHLAQRYAADRPDAGRIALTAAAIYLFNPVTWYDSAIWGQTDAAGACLMLAGVIALLEWPSEAAAAIAVLAALVKPQFGAILVPLIGTALLRRHLLSANGASSPSRTHPSRHDGPARLLSSAVTGIIVFYALIAPFNLGAYSFLEKMRATANIYPFLSVNAYNPWALIGSGGIRPLAFGTLGNRGWSPDDIPLLGHHTGVSIGTTLLLLAFLAGAARLLWRADRWSVVLVGTYLSMCFFMLPTRVHERYLFVAFAFASLLAAFDRRWLYATLALAVGSFINLHGVLTTVPMGSRWLLGASFRSPAGILISVALHTAVFLFVIWQLRSNAASCAFREHDVRTLGPFETNA